MAGYLHCEPFADEFEDPSDVTMKSAVATIEGEHIIFIYFVL